MQDPRGGRPRRAGWGAAVGLLGAAAGAALGCAAGDGIRHVGAFHPDAVLATLPLALLAFAPAGAAAGAAAGLAGGRLVGRRAVLPLTILAIFWPAAAGAVVAAQAGLADGLLVFVLGAGLLFAVIFPAAGWCVRRRTLRWLLLGWLIVCLAGEGYSRLRPRRFAPLSPAQAGPVVQLRSAPLPGPLGVVAVHYWFAAFDPQAGRWSRWEVWQHPDRGGTSWGHVHKDLMAPDAGVGGGPGRVEHEWRGPEALALIATLRRSGDYPDRGRYFAWPGPNSNTYVAWVLREAGVPADVGPLGLGKDYRGACGAGLTTTGVGVQAETPVVGAAAGLRDGVEVRLLGLTLGAGAWPPCVKTPLGRVGFVCCELPWDE